MIRQFESRLYIAGEWVSPADGRSEAVINPATEEIAGEAALAGPRELEAALASARHAFDKGPWPRMTARERIALLARLIDWLEARAEDVRGLIMAETGSVQPFLRTMQYATGLEHARHYLELADHQAPVNVPLETVFRPDGSSIVGGALVTRDPVGVCLAITPFNVPFTLNLGKCIPALVMGNTCILKPSPLTPFSALVIAAAAHEAGLPAGVFNVVNGDAAASEALTTDPRVDLITFTGSDRVGAMIQAQAARTLKRCIMELGGKSAMIVREDADLAAAVANAHSSLTLTAGQACAAMTRLVVHNSIRPRFVQMVADLFAKTRIGDPADPESRMGPLIRGSARDRVATMVAQASADGARLVAGGRVPPSCKRGFFYEPTLFDDVDNSWAIAQQEVFGPVGVVIGFDTDDEAIAIANDSDFGLSGGIYSANLGRALEIAAQLRTGKVNLNGGSGKMSALQPFGGIKRSGYGREFGELGLHEFTYVKTVSYHLG